MNKHERILSEFRQDRPAFRKSHRVLEDGRKYGEVYAPFQEEIFLELESKEVNKHFLVLPRGADKTSGFGAWHPLEELLLVPGSEIVVIGTDSDVGILNLKEMHGYCERNQFLNSLVKRNRNEISVRNGRITVLSSDAASSFGLKPTLVVIDEFSNWWKDSHEQLFWSLFSSIAKRPGSRILILSNSGAAYSKLYFQLKEKIEADSSGWFLYAPTDLEIPWMNKEELESQKRILPPQQYARLFQNIDTPSNGNFVSTHELEACVDDALQPAEKGKPDRFYFLGLDYGRKHDRTAVSVVHMEDNKIILDDCWHKKGSRENPVSFSLVEGILLDFASRFNISGSFVDPYQMQATMEKLRGQIPMSEFIFSAGSWSQLAQSLYFSIHHNNLRLYRDPIILNEILALQMVETPQGLKFDHARGFYSDIATSLALAITACMKAGGGSDDEIFWTDRDRIEGVDETLEQRPKIRHTFEMMQSGSVRRVREEENESTDFSIGSIPREDDSLDDDLENY